LGAIILLLVCELFAPEAAFKNNYAPLWRDNLQNIMAILTKVGQA